MIHEESVLDMSATVIQRGMRTETIPRCWLQLRGQQQKRQFTALKQGLFTEVK